MSDLRVKRIRNTKNDTICRADRLKFIAALSVFYSTSIPREP